MSCSVHVQFPAGKPITVSVNGISIARDAIQREMQHHPAAKPIAAWQQAARALVIRELLLQRAKHLDLAPEPICDKAGRRETDEEALMRAVVDREVTVPEPDDETCRRYYERNRARFRSSDIYEVSHILFAAVPENHEDYAQARAEAAAVLATLQEKSGMLCRARQSLFAMPIGGAGRQHRPDHRRDRQRRNSSRRLSRCCRASSAPSPSLPVTDSISSGSTASMKGRCCPMRWSSAASLTTCAKACAGAPTHNTSRGW